MGPAEGVSRRSFLRSAGAAGAIIATGAACASATEPGAAATGASQVPAPSPGSVRVEGPRPDEATARRVVVIGAGLAGLTAALDLDALGWDVVVLEARERVGGRVLTVTDPFTEGLHAEMGGESIDDNHHAILALVDRYGLTTERRPRDKWSTTQVFRDGRRRPIDQVLSSGNGRVLEEYTRFGESLYDLAQGMDANHPEQFARAEELDRRSLQDHLDGLRLSSDAQFLVRTAVRGEYNAELDAISLLFAVQQEAAVFEVDEDASETMRVAGGNARLTDAMQAALGPRVVLGAPVTSVRWGNDGVTVASAARTVTAARAVVALPTPPLRRITFTPALPGALGRAVAELDLGTAVKVSTEYREQFWRALPSSGFTLSDQPFQMAWSASDSSGRRDDPGILTQFSTGDAAVRAAQVDDGDRMRAFGAQLDEVYPEGAGSRTPHQATLAWANEEHTGGGYTVFRPGQLTLFWPAIRRGIGPLSFAGEHTEDLAGYMESAVRSGHRVAREIGPAPR